MTLTIIAGIALLTVYALIIVDLIRMHRRQRLNMKRWEEEIDRLALPLRDEEVMGNEL